jgi:hypothetical protein
MRGEGKRDPRPADAPGRLRQQANARKQSANLIPFQPGQTGNPDGKNGAKWLAEFKRFFDSRAFDSSQNTRFYNVCNALYTKALKGDVNAQRVIIEQMQGKAKESVDLTSSDRSMSPAASAVEGMTSAEQRRAFEAILAKATADASYMATGPAAILAEYPSTNGIEEDAE